MRPSPILAIAVVTTYSKGKYMKRSIRKKSAPVAAGVAGVVLALSLGHGQALAQSEEAAARSSSTDHPRRKPEFPRLNLRDAKSQGQRAIDLLGDRLPEVAAQYGKSPDEFRAKLRQDKRLKIDRNGRLFVEDELDEPVPADTDHGAHTHGHTHTQFAESPVSAAVSASISGALLPLDQTFLLNSRPGAPRTIYLNFKGAQLKSTAWNGSTPTLTALPYDLDGIPYTFSTTELQRIQYIWQRVAEDFAPFDVNVTTAEPASGALTRSGSTDGIFGTTVLITKRSGVYSCSCGGVAYIGIFDDTSDYYKPALVFYDALGGGSEKAVAEAISHEAGHNMGLLHDGSATTGYYTGHGSGPTGWAPIMGVGYNKPLVQWSKGEYASANNVQDDYAVMGFNGLPLRVDDHGNTSGTATAMPITVPGAIRTLEAHGVVERPTDVDVFSFSSGPGSVSFTLATAARSANLDAMLELRNSAGTLLASANPVDLLSATLSWTVPAAGTYYISVRGVGKGDRLTTGYTDYGSLGQYRLTGTVPSSVNLVPVAVATVSPSSGTVPFVSAFNGSGSYDSDGRIVAYEWNFGDGSPVVSGPTANHSYTNAGNYTATLKVTDNGGLTSFKSLAISALAPAPVNTVAVADIAMSVLWISNSRALARADVKVVDAGNKPVQGATVTAAWSGLVTGSVSGVTGSTGIVTFWSPTSASSGTFRLGVTGVSLSGYTYDSSQNVETSDAITR